MDIKKKTLKRRSEKRAMAVYVQKQKRKWDRKIAKAERKEAINKAKVGLSLILPPTSEQIVDIEQSKNVLN